MPYRQHVYNDPRTGKQLVYLSKPVSDFNEVAYSFNDGKYWSSDPFKAYMYALLTEQTVEAKEGQAGGYKL